MSATPARPVTTPAAGRSRRPPTPPLVSLLTDFGERDPWVAICRGVILEIAPNARLLDISHDVTKFSILDGALVLRSALPYLPVGVHMAVVDPGVGTARLPIVLSTARGDALVGPDNGLLIPAAEVLGGVVGVHVLEREEYQLPVVSASFHGRDIFAPAAAHLALGVAPGAFGRSLDPASLVRLEVPTARVQQGELHTAVVYVDSFGNAQLAGDAGALRAAIGELSEGARLRLSFDEPRPEALLAWAPTFGTAEVGTLLCYEDSCGRLCVAVNQGDAAARLGLRQGDRVTIRRS